MIHCNVRSGDCTAAGYRPGYRPKGISMQKTTINAALLASVLIVSGVGFSRAETLDFSYVDSDGNKASWVQQSNPVCPGPGGCSFPPPVL